MLSTHRSVVPEGVSFPHLTSRRARARRRVMTPPPVVAVVVGPTGSGKSRLAIDLALALDADVVNADALQMHRDLPVCTARVRDEERRGVAHHLVGFVEYGERFDVRAFVTRARGIVEDAATRGRSVVVAGGTNYYAQALVSDSLMDVSGREDDHGWINDISDEWHPNSEGRRAGDAGDEDAASAHARLTAVDPESAKRLHPNDVRRVRRYLEIYHETGMVPSELFKKERTMRCFSSAFDALGVRTVFIALSCDAHVLDRVIRRRVSSMLELGLVDELKMFARDHGVDGDDDARGDVRQAIGYAEWKTYLRAHVESSTNNVSDVELKAMHDEAVEMMIQHTCRLARRQQARLQTFAHRYGWPVHFIDVTEAMIAHMDDDGSFDEVWNSHVAVVALKACLDPPPVFQEPSVKSVTRREEHETIQNEWRTRMCECCKKTLRGDVEWEAHVTGRRHRRASCASRKRQKGEFGTKHPDIS